MKTIMSGREVKETAGAVVVAMVLAIIIVLVAIFFFSKPAHGAEAKTITGSFVITGYGSGEFAIKGEPEETLNSGVANVKDLMRSLSGDLQLQFVAVGSADTTGSSVGNDELAAKRADQVKAVLSANFSDAKIVAWSKGDAENAKQVRVEYKIIPVPVAPAPLASPAVEKVEVKSAPRIEFYILLGMLVVALISVFWVTGSQKRQNKVKRMAESGPQWIKDLDVGNETYYVKVEVKNGVWYSPFTSKNGTQICRDSRRRLIESLKGCLKKDEFNQQKIELIRKGVINVAGER